MSPTTVAIIGSCGYPSYYGGFETAVRKIAPYPSQSGNCSATVYGRPNGGEAREDLPLEPGLVKGSYVLVVARFVPENTIPEFFEAIAEISKRVPW